MSAALGRLTPLIALALAGCAGQRVAVFPQGDGRLVFPPAPDVPRIRWVGELVGEASLGIRPTGGAAVRELLTGPAARVAFSAPNAVAVRGERVLVSDAQLGVIHVLDLAPPRAYANVTHAESALFGGPTDVAFLDGGAFAVSDGRRGAVFVFDADGRFQHTIGAGQLERPANLAWRAAAGQLWVVDAAAHQVLVFDRSGTLLTRFGRRGGAAGEFNYPAGLGVAPVGDVAVADAMNFRVQWLAGSGQVTRTIGRKGDAAGDFALPRDVAFDSDGHLYALDSHFENVQLFDRQGRLLMAFGREGSGPGEFALPSGITIDGHDRIWVADTYNRRVQVFQYLRETDRAE